MKKKWIWIFILINVTILMGSIFCLIMTSQNVRFINQEKASIVSSFKGNSLTVSIADGKNFELIFSDNAVKIKNVFGKQRRMYGVGSCN